MNIRIDVEISPRELRDFFGLPDVQPLQEEMMANIREQMKGGIEGFDAASLMKAGLPAHLQNLESFQRAMWAAMTGATERSKDRGKDRGKTED